MTFKKTSSSSLLTTNVTLDNEVLLLRSLNSGNIMGLGSSDGNIDISTLLIPYQAFQNCTKPNVQSCLLIIFQYQPISLQYS